MYFFLWKKNVPTLSKTFRHITWNILIFYLALQLFNVDFCVSFAKQIVLAGDPLQLGPVLRSKFAKQFGLELSLLERLINTVLYERNEDMFADHGSYDPLLVRTTNYSKHSKTSNVFLFLFPNKMLVFRAWIHKSKQGRPWSDCFFSNMLVFRAWIYKMLFRKANREDHEQTASSEAVWSGSALFVKPFLAGN